MVLRHRSSGLLRITGTLVLVAASTGCGAHRELEVTYRDASRLRIELLEEARGEGLDLAADAASQAEIAELEPGQVGVVAAEGIGARWSRPYSLAMTRTVGEGVELDVEVEGYERHRVTLISDDQVLRVLSTELAMAIPHGLGFTRTPEGLLGVHVAIAPQGRGLQVDRAYLDGRAPPHLIASVWVDERDVVDLRVSNGIARYRPLFAVLATFSAGIAAAGVALSVRHRPFLPMGVAMASLATPLLVYALTQLLRPRRSRSWSVDEALEWASQLDPTR
jgi:hypothetical protein